MRSKVTLMKHPIHPMLVSFPITLYVITLVGFLVYGATSDAFWFRVGYAANVAGVVMAFVAAIPGLIDWAYVTAPMSAARKTGQIHMTLNFIALALFGVNAWLQSGQWTEFMPNASGAVLFTALGVLATLGAGFFGWKMVQNHHVGVELTAEQDRLEPVLNFPRSKAS